MNEKSIFIAFLSHKNFGPKLILIYNERAGAKYEGICLKQDKISFNHKCVVIGVRILLFLLQIIIHHFMSKIQKNILDFD